MRVVEYRNCRVCRTWTRARPRCRRLWIVSRPIWPRTSLLPELFRCHCTNAFIHFCNLSAAPLGPFQPSTQQRGSQLLPAGMAASHKTTRRPSHQPGLGRQQLSTGHACLWLGMHPSRRRGSTAYSISHSSDPHLPGHLVSLRTKSFMLQHAVRTR